MESRLSAAIEHHRAGRLAEARALYRAILDAEPQNADALHLQGVIACQSQQYKEAIELIGRAVELAPDHPEYLVNLGEAQRRAGHLSEATEAFERAAALAPENPYPHYNLALTRSAAGDRQGAIEAYRRALARRPAFPEALNNLGLLFHESADYSRAADAFQRAIALRPQHAETHNNLGLAFWELHQPSAAMAAFSRAVEIRPDFASAHANLAFVLRRMGRRQEALSAFRKAAALNPASVEIQRDLAMALLEVGQPAEAVEAARRAVTLAPDAADAHHALGVALISLPPTDRVTSEAQAAYRRALELRPGVAEWEFELAALCGDQPSTAPEAYVRSLFDEYSFRFEHHLVNELHYRVPQDLLAAILQRRETPGLPPSPWDILDLGCGTGLVGELFRPHARHIVGVDLAPKMLALARERRTSTPPRIPVYDRLERGHILSALRDHPCRFDLILAADVFIYVGEIQEVLSWAAVSLRPGGILGFSIEHHDGEGFVLHAQRRFAHSLAYIREVARVAGLTEIATESRILRDDVPPGWIVLLQRPV